MTKVMKFESLPKTNHNLLDEIMFKSLERSTRLQRTRSLFLTHFITLAILVAYFCVSVLLACFSLFVFLIRVF